MMMLPTRLLLALFLSSALSANPNDPFSGESKATSISLDAKPFTLQIIYGDVPVEADSSTNSSMEALIEDPEYALKLSKELPDWLLKAGEHLEIAVAASEAGQVKLKDEFHLTYAIETFHDGTHQVIFNFKTFLEEIHRREIDSDITLHSGEWVTLGGHTRDEVKTRADGSESHQKMNYGIAIRIVQREIKTKATTVADSTPAGSSDIILEASGTVYVVVQEQETEQVLFRSTMSAEDKHVIERSGPVNILFTAGENLTIISNGEEMHPSSAGTAKISLP